MPAIGGAPGRTLASPHTPIESTTRGNTERGTANASSTSSFQSDPSTRRRPLVVADAFVWSLMWSDSPAAPPDRVHAIQLSTVPMHTSRPARSPLFDRSQAALVTD